MNSWIISIGIALLLTTFLTILLPKGKSAKFIKGISTIIVMLVVLKPFSALKNGGDLLFLSDDGKICVDENYIAYAIEKSIENKKNAVKKLCDEYGFPNSEVEMIYETDEYYSTKITGISVFINFDVINPPESRINIIGKLKEDICVAFSVADENVRINDKKF